MKKSYRERGQALVLVLLSLAVVLTLVLFILSRSVTDILVSSKNEESARAFSAAEAGIEQALVIGTGGSNSDLGNSAGYVSNVSDIAQNTTSFNLPSELSAGDTFTAWFVSHDDVGNYPVCDGSHPCFRGNSMQVCWGKPGTEANAAAPALEVSIFYDSTPGDASTMKIARVALEPYQTRAISSVDGGLPNAFDSVTSGGCTSGSFAFSKTINLAGLVVGGTPVGTANVFQFARMRMIYNNTPQTIGLNVSGGVLPSQGQDIVSTGTAGGSTRKVEVFQGWPEPPGILDNVLFSANEIVK